MSISSLAKISSKDSKSETNNHTRYTCMYLHFSSFDYWNFFLQIFVRDLEEEIIRTIFFPLNLVSAIHFSRISAIRINPTGRNIFGLYFLFAWTSIIESTVISEIIRESRRSVLFERNFRDFSREIRLGMRMRLQTISAFARLKQDILSAIVRAKLIVSSCVGFNAKDLYETSKVTLIREGFQYRSHKNINNYYLLLLIIIINNNY